ncbi:HAD family hydrolase [Isoptericola sp. BMS4]|uniref:HAD family hydrolase n=1 Tax=Isoptericola sp. BMS4 TaxID=2527875 RepID=UPI001423DAFD|nr:HAD family hydrolase [Isoptericola sp. BMS4]
MTGSRTLAIFLDVDGTYADRGVVPEAHVQAVRSARRAGHRVLLCTGRPASMLPDPLLDAGFDGVVASAGAYVRLDGEVLADRRFPAGLAADVVRVLDEHGIAYLLETPEAVYGPVGLDDRLVVRGDAAPSEILDVLRMPGDLSDVEFAKISYFDAPLTLDALRDRLGPEVDVLPSSYADGGAHAGEIQLSRVHKAVGVETVVTHLGLTAADVVAVGDGHNDTEMLAYAGHAVAVEGAPPALLASADLLVPGPAGHGVALAFERLGLLDAASIPGRSS